MSANRNRMVMISGALLGLLLMVVMAAPILGLPDPTKQDIANRLASALPGSPLGRDEFGRDVLSRLIWGARTSFMVAFAASFIAAGLGIMLGLVGAWYRGVTEIFTVRSMDVILCFPPVLLALLIVTLLGPSAGTLVFVIALLYLPGFCRVAYGEAIAARNNDYVEAVHALGLSVPRILRRTILPNIAGPLLVQFSLCIAAAIVLESGLSFLGLGVVPPSPSLGLMIRGARSTMAQAPWLLVWPCLMLTITILAVNAFCDRLRDAFDPKAGALARAPASAVANLPPAAAASAPGDALLRLRELTLGIASTSPPIRPVEDVTLAVQPGETLAIVGESGSGKSLCATTLMGLLPNVITPLAGEAWFDKADLLRLDPPAMRQIRGHGIAMVFQDPMSSLNPVYTVGEQVVEAILAHRALPSGEARLEALALFRSVGINDPEARLDAYPHELSGGMRQRVMIAIAIANRPRLLIADEPTTALDVTVQAQILDLLKGLQRDTGMAMIFISHNLGVVADIADRVAVMYAGQVVEQGPVAAVFTAPRHPYTRALLAALPEGEELPQPIAGSVPPPHLYAQGCRFADRCTLAVARCHSERQVLLDLGNGQSSRCWLAMAEVAA